MFGILSKHLSNPLLQVLVARILDVWNTVKTAVTSSGIVVAEQQTLM